MRRKSHLTSEQPDEMRLAEMNQISQRVERNRTGRGFQIRHDTGDSRMLRHSVAHSTWS